MKVSVVVPVFNTGAEIEALIESLRAQSLPRSEWEAVFVDDGSTDGTPDFVEHLIAGDENMRLLREKPSGWPGRPRNVGIDHARGDYVFFSDDDDTLGPEALERMAAFADEHRSDVVIPRTVGKNRGVPAITRTVVDAQREPALIMSSLAPQKLFRRAFLVEQGIRFREGHFRLEDHLFVSTAYLRATRVSTFADYPCYYLAYQTGRPHISQQQPDWHGYFGSVRACLDGVDAECRDPEVARVMRSRWLRVEALSRLRGVGYEKNASPSLVEEVRSLLVDRFPVEELQALKPIDRMLALLLVEGRVEEAEALAHWESSLSVATEVTSAKVERGGTVRIALRSALQPGSPLPRVTSDRVRYPSGAELLEHVAGYTRIGVELQQAKTKVRRPLEVAYGAEGESVATLAVGAEPLVPGRWDVLALAGEHRSRRRRAVQAGEGLRLPSRSRRVGAMALGFTDVGRISIRVQRFTPTSFARRAARKLRRTVLVPRQG
ncbi:glycosyltransferase family 2 protein [Amnibacterium setariae]|nr:glycosyltransferase family 2 protein [Amnibacterium setariae]